MRLFLAANFDAALRERLYDAATALREAAPSVAWVAPDRLHTTLKFLGEQDASLVPRLASSLRTMASTWSPCDLQLGGYGAFPNFRRPRVVWIGGEPAEPLAAIARSIDQVCGTMGLAREERPFRAHVTLGRVQRPLGRSDARRLERIALARHEEFPWHVRSVDIMHSVLGPSGPTYTVLESIALGATP